MTEETDRLALAPGPEEGPGKRKKITGAGRDPSSRPSRLLWGRAPARSPKSMQERLVCLMPGSKQILPAGDFREWDAIEAWAREIAAELVVKVPVA